jgi:N-acetylmuramoyl-L-alanine amidase
MDTRSTILEKVDKGTKLQVLEEHNKWYKVQLDNGVVGYAASTFIQPERLLYEKNAQPWGIVTTEKADLNIRADMKAEAAVLKKVKKQAKVLILENHGAWYKVQLEDGTVGYAASEFISKE